MSNPPGVLELTVNPGSTPVEFVIFIDKVANDVQLAPKFHAMLHHFKDVSEPSRLLQPVNLTFFPRRWSDCLRLTGRH